MRTEEKKPLPPCEKALNDATTVMRDFFRTAYASFSPAVMQELAKKLAAVTGCSSGKMQNILRSFLHLPCDAALVDLVEIKVRGWLPVLVAGGCYCEETDRLYAGIRQTVRLSDPEFNPRKGRWSLCLHVERGPLSGRKLTFQVSPRQAASMLMFCLGPRLAYRLDYVRPYDLHGLKLLVSFRRGRKAGSSLSIAGFSACRSFQQRNRRLERRRLAQCEKKLFRRVCFDCGAGMDECELARHTLPLAEPGKDCICCRTKKRRTNRHGLCTKCTDQMVSRGILPKPVIPEKKKT
jgi:hypothetical protein